MKKIRIGTALGVFALAVATSPVLTACGQESTYQDVEDCVVQLENGEYQVLDRKLCDTGDGYTSTNGIVYWPMWWVHSTSTGSYAPGSRVGSSVVVAGSTAKAKDAAALAKARSNASSLKAGSNKGGVSGTTKGGFGGGARGGGGGAGG